TPVNILIMIKHKLLFLFGLLLLTTIGYAQATLTGSVIDDQGQALVGVNVKNLNNEMKTQSDVEGNFSIPGNIGDALLISYLGYETLSYVAQTSAGNIVRLVSQGVLIDDVVVVGYRSEERRVGKECRGWWSGLHDT